MDSSISLLSLKTAYIDSVYDIVDIYGDDIQLIVFRRTVDFWSEFVWPDYKKLKTVKFIFTHKHAVDLSKFVLPNTIKNVIFEIQDPSSFSGHLCFPESVINCQIELNTKSEPDIDVINMLVSILPAYLKNLSIYNYGSRTYKVKKIKLEAHCLPVGLEKLLLCGTEFDWENLPPSIGYIELCEKICTSAKIIHEFFADKIKIIFSGRQYVPNPRAGNIIECFTLHIDRPYSLLDYV